MENKNNKTIVENKFIKKIQNNRLIKKVLSIKLVQKFFTKEIILYAIFGILTTIVNIGSFYIMNTFLHINENLANNIAIIIAVLVAYFTNKDMVFHSKAVGFREKFIEFCKFILGRLFTMIIESVGGSLLFRLPMPTIISKCIITVIVIILNFFISKFFTFKSSSQEKQN